MGIDVENGDTLERTFASGSTLSASSAGMTPEYYSSYNTDTITLSEDATFAFTVDGENLVPKEGSEVTVYGTYTQFYALQW